MRIVKQSDENEMISEFLKMEIDSDRYADKIEHVLHELNFNRGIILNADINSDVENEYRKKILAQFRGYPDKNLFERFPQKIDWKWTIFNKEDISKIIYIEYSYWNELSNYTGSPIEAAKTIQSGIEIFGIPNDNAITGAELIKRGHKFPPLIFLTDQSEKRYIILEGHGRMTSYGLVPQLFQNVSVLLGYCDSSELDNWYGKMPEREK